MYLVKGKFLKKKEWVKFNKTINADTEKRALEILYSIIGGDHKTKRKDIKIEGVEKIGKKTG